MIWKRIFLLAAACWAVSAMPARACSVSSDYVRPTNFELVGLAPAIVVATAQSQTRQGDDTAVHFRVESVLKGAPPPQIALEGTILGSPGPSDLRDLSRSHPEGYAGPCNRMSFARGGRYLLFLKRRDDGQWDQLHYAFSRENEDYAGEDNPWVRTVRRYVRLQQELAPMDQLAALQAMIESGRDRNGEPLEASELADMRDHFRSLSPFKPTAFLLDAYARLERGEAPAHGVRPDAANRENSDAERMAELALALGGNTSPPGPEGLEAQRLAVLEALINGHHPDALPLFERLSAAPGAGARIHGLTLRFLAANGQYPRVYRWIETELFATLARLGDAEANRLILDVWQVQHGDYWGWDEGHERWRGDAHAAATWPELALALERYRVRALGSAERSIFTDAIRAIPIADYRARPEITLALAEHYDPAVEAWAQTELARPAPPPRSAAADAASGYDWRSDPDLLPLRVLVSAWGTPRDELMGRIFCQGGRRRALVIRALGQWGEQLHKDLLARMAATAGVTADERALLVRAALAMTARAIDPPPREPRLLPMDEREWLLTRLLRGERIDATPLRCAA